MARSQENRLHRLWYADGYLHLLLAPLSLLFALASAVRRYLFRRGILASQRIDVPVIVIGNITAGGTGKTPVTIWLAKSLRERGFNPGIVSRGYGAVIGDVPVQAIPGSDPDIVGDEPLLMANRSQCPVVVHPNRVAAARELARMGVDVVLSDDGLQHYRLQRDFEIAVVDGARLFGNGWLLPAGPLRESRKRLQTVDRVLVQLESGQSLADVPALEDGITRASAFFLTGHALVSLDDTRTRNFREFGRRPVHAIAAIGNPERFFRSLEAHGLSVMRHPFPDHARFTARDVTFDDDADIVMTEKDAVKCREFATERHWYLPVDVKLRDDSWVQELEAIMAERQGSQA